MTTKQRFFMLRIKGREEFLTTPTGQPFLNVEWGSAQLQNVADALGVGVDELEVVPIGAFPEPSK